MCIITTKSCYCNGICMYIYIYIYLWVYTLRYSNVAINNSPLNSMMCAIMSSTPLWIALNQQKQTNKQWLNLFTRGLRQVGWAILQSFYTQSWDPCWPTIGLHQLGQQNPKFTMWNHNDIRVTYIKLDKIDIHQYHIPITWIFQHSWGYKTRV